MFTVYVLYSQKHDEIYIGFTADLDNRFLSHNELATKGHTIKYCPWVIAYAEEFKTKSEAMKREVQLKTANGRAFAWSIVRQKFGSIRWLERRIHIRWLADGSSILLPATIKK